MRKHKHYRHKQAHLDHSSTSQAAEVHPSIRSNVSWRDYALPTAIKLVNGGGENLSESIARVAICWSCCCGVATKLVGSAGRPGGLVVNLGHNGYDMRAGVLTPADSRKPRYALFSLWKARERQNRRPVLLLITMWWCTLSLRDDNEGKYRGEEEKTPGLPVTTASREGGWEVCVFSTLNPYFLPVRRHLL